MRLPKTKELPYGEGEHQKLTIRQQGHKVRIQDQVTGALYLLDPAIARRLSAAINYAAKHAEIIRIPGAGNGQPAQEDQRLP